MTMDVLGNPLLPVVTGLLGFIAGAALTWRLRAAEVARLSEKSCWVRNQVGVNSLDSVSPDHDT